METTHDTVEDTAKRPIRPEAEPETQEQDLEDGVEAEGSTGLWPIDRLKPVLEAVIFAAADPLPVRRIRDVVDGATPAEVTAALRELRKDFEQRGFRLVEVAGGWQFRTAPEHQTVVKRLFKERPHRLTRAMIETVAIVAYKQPATRAEIESVRGVDASGVLENLVERRLVRVAGRRDVPGRPLVYATTAEFLELFGLKDLKSLPTLGELGDELQGLADQAGFNEGEDRDAPILPLEEQEEGSVYESTAAETAAEAGSDGEEGSGQERRREAGGGQTHAPDEGDDE